MKWTADHWLMIILIANVQSRRKMFFLVIEGEEVVVLRFIFLREKGLR